MIGVGVCDGNAPNKQNEEHNAGDEESLEGTHYARPAAGEV